METCQYLSTHEYHNAKFRHSCYGDIISTKIVDVCVPIVEQYSKIRFSDVSVYYD